MTINKSQRQTLEQVAVYLPAPVFSHDQLYVAFSRLHSTTDIHIVLDDSVAATPEIIRNIVYTEIFRDLQLHTAG